MSAIPNLPETIERNNVHNVAVGVEAVHRAKQGTDHVEKVNGGQVNGVKSEAAPWLLHDVPVDHQRPIRVIVIGAGYSGVYCGIRIPERLRNCELVIYEKNAGIGGTW